MGTRWLLFVTLMRTRLRSVSTAGDSREQSKPGILILLPFVIYVNLNLGGGGVGVRGGSIEDNLKLLYQQESGDCLHFR